MGARVGALNDQFAQTLNSADRADVIDINRGSGNCWRRHMSFVMAVPEGNGNDPLDKAGALLALRLGFAELGRRPG